MSTWQTQAFLLPADHPSAAGHFPGNPIIPGALLLDAVIAAAAGDAPDVRVHNTKFLIPIPHGTGLELRWQTLGQAAGAKIRFECRTGDDALVLSGNLSVGAS
jgi:3-hydroxymyristoyl/3-hydroxydecanoyl-(acyl carrier protein) dehydratase